jgi:hypothetical protein
MCIECSITGGAEIRCGDRRPLPRNASEKIHRLALRVFAEMEFPVVKPHV